MTSTCEIVLAELSDAVAEATGAPGSARAVDRANAAVAAACSTLLARGRADRRALAARARADLVSYLALALNPGCTAAGCGCGLAWTRHGQLTGWTRSLELFCVADPRAVERLGAETVERLVLRSGKHRALATLRLLEASEARFAAEAVLVEALRHRHWVVAEAAARVLGKVGPVLTNRARSALMGALQHPKSQVRWAALRALDKAGLSRERVVELRAHLRRR